MYQYLCERELYFYVKKVLIEQDMYFGAIYGNFVFMHMFLHTHLEMCTGKTSIKPNTAGKCRDGEFQAKIEDF